MKIYPTKKYSITLFNEHPKAVFELKKETLRDGQFVSDWNKYSFIGEIDETNFEIKLCKKLYGNFCVFKGRLEGKAGVLEIGIDRTYKFVLFVIFLFPIFGFLTSLFNNGFKNSVVLLFPTIMFIVILRFVFIELGFQIISKKGVNKMSEIIGVEKMNKE
jgi:hypothetical protein